MNLQHCYYIWDVIKKETSQQPHNTKDSLKATIIDVMGSINENYPILASRRFHGRIVNEGGFTK